jgi:hypothetical protein
MFLFHATKKKKMRPREQEKAEAKRPVTYYSARVRYFEARPISSSSSVRRDVHVQTKGGRERSPSGKVRCTQYESLLGLGTCLLGGVKLRRPQLDGPAVAAASSSSWRTRS